MMRLLSALAALFFAAVAPAHGQPSNPGIQRFGAVTPGNCVEWLNNFQVQDAGFACSGLAPAGASGTLQYNNAGAFGGVSGWTTNGTTALTGGASTTLAIGGCTIGGNALCATGTSLFNSQITNALGTITSSAPLSITATFNNGGTTFNLLNASVTDTASADATTFLNFSRGGARQFSIDKRGAPQVGAGTIPSALITYWTGGVSMLPATSVPTMFATTNSNWVGPSLIGFGDGAIANQGVTTTYPFLEFARAGGTNAAPTNISTSWVVGEIAYVGYVNNSYQALALIQGVTRSDDATKGQVNIVLGNSIDITNPAYTFNAVQMWGRGSALFGSVSTKNTLTNGVQVSNTSATSNFNMVRVTANTYAYYGVTPEATLDATHPHWGIGLYDSTYGLTTWSYDGSSNTIRSVWTVGGLYAFGGITSSFSALKGNGAALETKLADDSAYANHTVLGLQTTATVVGSLPTCNAGAQGLRRHVTDANATTFASTVAGGGANVVPVFCDGTNWIIG
jgi:hypothetical protein